MKKLFMVAAVLLLVLSCQELNVTTLTIDGAVFYQETTGKLSGAYGVFVVAKANIDAYDRNALPEVAPPVSDTTSTFPRLDIPSFLTPLNNATVKVNDEILSEAYDGQYQGSLNNITPQDTVDILVATQEGDTGKATMIIPGNFSLNIHDTAFVYDSISSLDLSWTHSENASSYLVIVYKVDSTAQSPSLIMKETTQDTTYSISKDNLEKGQYLIQVASVYGRLNASMPQSGTMIGVLGQVATLFIKKPVLITLN